VTRGASLLLVLAVPLVAARGQAEPRQTHGAVDRVAYIKIALQAVRETPPDTLAQENEYARALSRGACSSAVPRLKVECLMTASRRYCRRRGESEARRCQAGMDVAVSNLLGDAQLIAPDKRYQIMMRKDYRRELAREIRRIQGALAVDFRLRKGEAEDDDSLAKNIDQYCLATADDTNLAWQTCVSSLVWFIGTASTAKEARKE